jgi:membrane-bound inhibitor of C-type lysozyme
MPGRVSITDVDASQIVYGADGLNFPLSKVPATSGAKYIGPLPDSGGVLAFWWDMGESAHYGLILHEDEPTLMGECRKAPADTDADGS